jgi:predicted ArsR family transcriptional regulator
MSKFQKNQKPATPKSLLTILVAMREAGATKRTPVTASEVNTNAIYMGRLQERGLVTVAGKVDSGKRGRPAHRYALTSTGRGRADRALVKAGE